MSAAGPNVHRLVCRLAVVVLRNGGGPGDLIVNAMCRLKVVYALNSGAAEAWRIVNCLMAAPKNPHGSDVEAIAGEVLAEMNKEGWAK